MGSASAWLQDEAALGNEVAKEALAGRPKVHEHLLSVYSAFDTLSADRQIGFGSVGAIPFTAIDRYAARYGFDAADDFDRFLDLIRAMDTVFLKFANKANSDGGKA